MNISLINSQSLTRLLALTEKKEELLEIIDQIDASIIETLRGGVSVEVVASASATPAPKPVPVANAPAAKPAKKKSKMSAEGRAKIAAAMKARWAAHRAGKGAAPTKSAVKPTPKGFKLPKKA